MGFFDFFKKDKTELPKTVVKPFTLDNIKCLIDLTLNANDAQKLKLFVDSTVNQHLVEDLVDEAYEFNSQEIIDYMYEEEICFYGFFDWKQESEDFDSYIVSAMKKNFGIDFISDNLCDLDELGSIAEVYKIYGIAIEKYGIALCNIDIQSDSYQVMLVRNEHYNDILQPVLNLGYTVEHYTQEW